MSASGGQISTTPETPISAEALQGGEAAVGAVGELLTLKAVVERRPAWRCTYRCCSLSWCFARREMGDTGLDVILPNP